MLLSNPEDKLTRKRDRNRPSGTGRVTKRRDFELCSKWTNVVTDGRSMQHMAPPRVNDMFEEMTSGATNRSSFCNDVAFNASIIPTEPGRHRILINRRKGSGRSTHLRSFNLQLCLPVASIIETRDPELTASVCMISHSSPAATAALSSSSSYQPSRIHSITSKVQSLGLNSLRNTPAPSRSALLARTPGYTFTPMEGVPEKPLTVKKLPFLLRHQPLSASSDNFNCTPMEGIPERMLPLLHTSSRLARLARLPVWGPSLLCTSAADKPTSVHQGHQAEVLASRAAQPGAGTQFDDMASAGAEEEEELMMHRADDQVLRSEPASPVENDCPHNDREQIPEAEPLHVQGIPQSQPVTPYGPSITLQHGHEVEVQTGLSLQDGIVMEPCGAHGRENEAGPSHVSDMHPTYVETCLHPKEPSSLLSSELDDAPITSGIAEPVRARRQAGERENTRNKRRKSLAGDGLALDLVDGRRKSTRGHQRPLEYWRNEHKIFGRDHKTLPTVVRVETRTPNPLWPLTDKATKMKRRARTKN
ncbi:hypothetical protein CEUSTIGMA_g629.t1 [Chlamydomonas eustigma]|uniref:Uncharacterized protein n=1 Tax=Chlamydomonas eustigma TaxID=1157962 RepID=A0A250WR54_9CHLO|nr:hypothetical protein CEUSTIGMA_g629.t1 [Chlamydomonas eustigma]|eukprot:GAX73176.1 hypothetical protein CEUSTIGMA_g629.t1 [Chlamydomonas eustigma]